MLRKILICAALTATLIVAGCGEEKIIGTPDKAVLAYAETVMTGESANLSAGGLDEDDRNAIRKAVAATFIASMENIAPLSDDTAQEIAQKYFDKLKGNVALKTTLKSEGAQPIVDLTTTTVDQAATAKIAAANNDELIALIGMVGKLKSDGATDEQIKDNPDVQKLAVSAVGKYIDGIVFRPEKTFEIPCQKVTGASGNTHWMPADGKALIDLLTGQN